MSQTSQISLFDISLALSVFSPAHTADAAMDCSVLKANYHSLVQNTETTTPVPREVKPKEHDYGALWAFFGWLLVDVIKKMFEETMQYAKMPMSSILQKH